VQYAAAALLSFGALFIESWLQPLLAGDRFGLSYGAVVLAAWVGGIGPGLMAIAVSAVGTAYFLVSPSGSLAVGIDDAIRLAVFILTTTLVSSLLNRERIARNLADRSLRLRNELLSNISHDLKNPLAIILANAQLLRRLGPSDDERGGPSATDRLRSIEETVASMADRLDELVDAARLAAGEGLELHHTSIDLVALAQLVVCRFESTTNQHQIVVECQVEKVRGFWDQRRLVRVLENLIGNAIKYSPNRGVVRVLIAREGDRAVLQVQDEGIGIPEADIPRLFNTYQRAGNAVGHIAGNGLGLAGSRHIVEQHGGTISVASQEGVGSTFVVWLPLNAA
jgi:signal transduction histidine kinase